MKFTLLWVGAIAVISANVGFSQDLDSPRESTIFNFVLNGESRVPMRSSEFPWSAIGKVFSDKSNCTGTLVGEDLVVTNAHCVLGADGKLFANIRFLPNFVSGRSRLASVVQHVWYGTPKSGKDWALLRLRSPLGSTAASGHLGAYSASIETMISGGWQRKLILVGYSSDFEDGLTAGVEIGCSVASDAGALGFYHACDAISGASGGPIFGIISGSLRLVGLHWGEDLANFKNLGSPASHWVEKLIELQKNDEGKPAETYLQICNRSGKRSLSSAVAFFKEGWRARGWHTVANNTCLEVPLPQDYNGDIFVRGEAGSSTWGDGPHTFCVSDSAFEATNADQRCGSGRWARFGKAFQVKKGKYNEYTFFP